ncbi:gamma-glutamyltransferase [Brevibacillus composti]|uniref:gamma-glutamyltransferase n=1 Tax=Brevibacillus composti TaxID=2796470 RepID=UPI003899630A
MKAKAKALVSATAALLLLASPVHAQVPGIPSGETGATKGIVAVSHPAAAQVGKDILQQGGNAIDAAAGIQLALNVVEPQMSGIGGGGFMMIYLQKQKKITVIDSREMAPQSADPRMFLDAEGKPIPFDERHTNGKAVGVPGTLLGLDTALKKYGTMKLSQVIDPAIGLAEQGVPVNWINARHIADSQDKLLKHKTAGEVFVPGGKPLAEGELLIQPDLAKTFKLIKEKGTDVLYKGEIGEALVKEVNRTGGAMTMEDLKKYKVVEREPVKGTFRGYEIVSMSPPSSGGLTLIQILKLMEGFDNKKDGPLSAAYLHRLIEANHLAYADRAAYMADEDFYPVPKTGLLHEEYIKERRQLIQPDRVNREVKAGDPWPYEGKKAVKALSQVDVTPVKQTTHFSVMDKWGNLVSYTTTIEDVFGSGIMVPGYGFMLNNELTDFDAVPGGVNEAEPGKRPRSSMTPTIVLKDGKPFMAVGSPGGSTIIASVSQTILNVLEHDMPIREAILSPRIFSSSYPSVTWEAGIDQDVVLQLMAMGHGFRPAPENIGNVQAVIYDFETGRMYGGADNTREGTVLGVDAVAFTSAEPPAPAKEEKAAFAVKVNGHVYPYTAEQLVLWNGEPYVQAEKLLLGLGGDPDAFQSERISLNGRSYLSVKKAGEGLGYTVEWDAKEAVVSLQKP